MKKRIYVHSDGQTIKKVCLFISWLLRMFTRYRCIGSYVPKPENKE